MIQIQSHDPDFCWKIQTKRNSLICWLHWRNIARHITQISNLCHIMGKLNFLIVKNDQNHSAASLQVTDSLIPLYPEFLINYILRRAKIPFVLRAQAFFCARWIIYTVNLITAFQFCPQSCCPFGHFNLIPLRANFRPFRTSMPTVSLPTHQDLVTRRRIPLWPS